MKTFALLITFTVNPAVVSGVNGFVAGNGSSQIIEFVSKQECEESLTKIVSYYSQKKNMIIADGICMEKTVQTAEAPVEVG